MDSQILKRVRPVAELRRHSRAAGVRRVIGATKEIDAAHFAAGAVSNQSEGPEYDGVHAGGVIDGEHQSFLARDLDHAVAIGGSFGHGLFHEDVTAHFHGFDRQCGVRARRREHVNNLGPRLRHGLERWISNGDAELLGESLRAAQFAIGDPDNLDKRQASQCAGMVRADVSRSDQSYPDNLILFQKCPQAEL